MQVSWSEVLRDSSGGSSRGSRWPLYKQVLGCSEDPVSGTSAVLDGPDGSVTGLTWF